MFFSGSPLEEMENAVRSLLNEARGDAPEGRVPASDSGENPDPEASPGHDHHQHTEGTHK